MPFSPPLGATKSPFFLDPVNEIVSTLPDIGSVAEGHLAVLKSTPPTLNLKKNGTWVTTEVLEGAELRVLGTNKEYTRVGNELQLTNDDLDLPFILRVGLTEDIVLSDLTPIQVDLEDPFNETLYLYLPEFDRLDQPLARGSWTNGQLISASSEGIRPQMHLFWKSHVNEGYPVKYACWVVSEDNGATWSVVHPVLWQQIPQIQSYTESVLIDIEKDKIYRPGLLLKSLATSEDVINKVSSIGVGRNTEAEKVAISNANLLLPPIITQLPDSDRVLNTFTRTYTVKIQSASASPTSLDLALFEEGNAIAVETKPQIVSGISPGLSVTATFTNLQGFNGAVPKKYYLRAEVN